MGMLNEDELADFYNASTKLVRIETAFPNPTSDAMMVRLQSNYDGEVEWHLHDLVGNAVLVERHLLSKNENEVFLNLSNLPQGTYTLYPKTPNRVLNPIKVIKL
jgi:hypothetical protein